MKVVPGQSIRVQLMDRRPFPGSSLVWTVSSTNPAVLELRSSEHGAAAPLKDSPYTAIFIARRSGTAQIQAVGATTCEAMRKSACPDRAADVTVEVA